MRIKQMVLIVGTASLLAGCATQQGGTSEQYGTSTGGAEGYPQPIASPTFRPGMNQQDPRDSHFTTRPQPQESPTPTAAPP